MNNLWTRMKTIGASEARTHFARLLNRVAQGERIAITRHGTPAGRPRLEGTAWYRVPLIFAYCLKNLETRRRSCVTIFGHG